MEKIKKIICSDIMSIRNGKTNSIGIIIFGCIFSVIIGFFISPIFGIFGIMIPALFVNVLFETESKYHSEKLYSILPVKRSDVVKARFISSFIMNFVISLLMCLFMFLAFKLKSYTWFTLGDAIDMIRIYSEMTGGVLSESVLINVWLFSFIGFSFLLSGVQLRGNFKKYLSGNVTLGYTKSDVKGLAFIMILLTAFIIINVTGITGPLVSIVSELLIKLLSVYDGLFFSVMVLAVSMIFYFYNFACTLLEYDSREL